MTSYITKIKAKVSIYATKKSSNVFDGSYKSIFVGNGLDFENLREYIPGDNIRDIDWKASSRSGRYLVKRYVAERKHNVMFVFDTGKKMMGSTKGNEIKKTVALYTAGTIGYLASKNGDNIGAMFNSNGMINFFQLKAGLLNLERILTQYDIEDCSDYKGDLNKNLDYIIKNIRRKMVIFIISDANGLYNVDDNILKKLTHQHDVLFVDISDADFTDGKSYDVDKDMYIPEFISSNKKLRIIEQETKKQIFEECSRKLIRHGIVSTQIDNEEEIIDKVIALLEGHRYANNR